MGEKGSSSLAFVLKADNRITKIRFLFYSWQIGVYVMFDIILGLYVMGDMGVEITSNLKMTFLPVLQYHQH